MPFLCGTAPHFHSCRSYAQLFHIFILVIRGRVLIPWGSVRENTGALMPELSVRVSVYVYLLFHGLAFVVDRLSPGSLPSCSVSSCFNLAVSMPSCTSSTFSVQCWMELAFFIRKNAPKVRQYRRHTSRKRTWFVIITLRRNDPETPSLDMFFSEMCKGMPIDHPLLLL